MTGNASEKSPEAIRQERRRAKLKAQGIEVVEIALGPVERAQLAEGCKVRGGLGGPYSVPEYLATLLRRDAELLAQERGQLEGRLCANCNKPLPRGCGGLYRFETPCLVGQVDRVIKL